MDALRIASSPSMSPILVPLPIDFIRSGHHNETLEQRRTQRYKLQLPLRIIQLGEQRVDRVEQTRDISSGGVCFMSPSAIEVGGRIEYVITLSGSTPPVQIRCLGKVLRSQHPDGAEVDGLYEVAVTMERYQFVRSGELASLPAV
jgi:hypothetical protein